MGMEYLPVYSEQGAPTAQLQVAAATLQKLGVRTAPATVSPLPDLIRAGGVVEYDERATQDIFAPTNGWLRDLSVRTVGESVKAGQLLFELYSPSLVTADELYVKAGSETDPTRNPYIAALRAQGLTDDLIADVREKRRRPGHIPFRASAPGVVTQLCCKAGALLNQGTSVMRLAPLGAVWVTVSLAAADATGVAVGSHARVTSEAFPGRIFDARVKLVYADPDPVARSLRARLELLQNEAALQPNMYVSVNIEGTRSAPVLHVPREAVIADGDSDRVIVALEDGHFAVRAVSLGRESAPDVAILEGLKPGERVVTTGVFLLDSEASVRAGLNHVGSAGARDAPAATGDR